MRDPNAITTPARTAARSRASYASADKPSKRDRFVMHQQPGVPYPEAELDQYAPTSGCPLPPKWQPGEAVVTYAREAGLDVEHERELFVALCESSGKRSNNWDAAFRVHCLRSIQFGAQRKAAGVVAPGAAPNAPTRSRAWLYFVGCFVAGFSPVDLVADDWSAAAARFGGEDNLARWISKHRAECAEACDRQPAATVRAWLKTIKSR